MWVSGCGDRCAGAGDRGASVFAHVLSFSSCAARRGVGLAGRRRVGVGRTPLGDRPPRVVTMGTRGGVQRGISGMGTASASRSCGMVSARRVPLRPLVCAIVMPATSTSETIKITTSLSMLCASPQQGCGDVSPVSSPHVSHLALSRTHSFSSMSHPSGILGPCARRSR